MYQLFTDDGISATIKVKGYPTVTKSGYDGLGLLHWAEEVMVRVFAQKLTGTLVSIAEVMETLGDFNIDAVYGDRLSIIDDSGFRNFVREEV